MKNLYSLLAICIGSLSLSAQTPTIRFDTVNEMVAFPGAFSPKLTAIVGGRHTLNDGGGGIFIFSAISATSTNNETVFKPNVTNGRWLKLYELIYGPAGGVLTGNFPTPGLAGGLPITNIADIANNSLLGNFTGGPSPIQVLTSMSSSNLAQVLSDETGTGVVVLDTDPTFRSGITITTPFVPDGATIDLFLDEGIATVPRRLGEFHFYGRDSVGQKTQYAAMYAESANVTNGQESGRLLFNVTSPTAQFNLAQFLRVSGETMLIDWNPGFFGPDDMDFRVQAQGAINAFFIQGSDGKIGINTGVPNYRLHVVGTNSNSQADAIARFYANPTKGLWFGYNITNSLGLIGAASDGASHDNMMLAPFGGNIGVGFGSVNQTPVTKLGVRGNISVGNNYGFFPAPASSITVEEKVGIGTTNPTYRLHVRGTNTVDQLSAMASFNATDTKRLWLGYNATNSLGLIGAVSDGASHDSIMLVPFGGNVGISGFFPNTPPSRLTVRGNASVGDDYAIIAAPTNGLIVQGNVGIGTNSPKHKFHVVGSPSNNHTNAIVRFNAAANQGLWLGYNTTNSVGMLGAATDGVSHNDLWIAPFGGNVGIGTTNPFTRLSVNGPLALSGTTNLLTDNGATLLRNGVPIAGGTNIVSVNAGDGILVTDGTNISTRLLAGTNVVLTTNSGVISINAQITGDVIATNIISVFNVKNYGAVGDGINNDRPAITNATQLAASAGGGIVYFPPGAYYVPAQIDWPISSNITWRGAGMGASHIILDAGAAPALSIGIRIHSASSNTPIRFVTFRDMTIRGPELSDNAPFDLIQTRDWVNDLMVFIYNFLNCFGPTMIDSGVGSVSTSGFQM